MEFPTAGKPIQCKAAITLGINKPTIIDTVEVAVPKSWEVRVKVVATGVCHSDLFYIEGGRDDFPFPCILGHEGAGIVESVGKDVTNVKPGDHVVLLFIPQCRECKLCKHPKTNMCEKFEIYHDNCVMYDNTTRITYKGQQVYQFNGISTFSEYTVAGAIAVVKINDKAPMDKVCLLGCCICTGYGSAINAADVQPGSTCAVWGLGGVGMAVLMGCRARGAKRIIGIDVNPDKYELAKKFGCTEFLNPNDYNEPIEDVLIKMTGGLDYTFVSVGNIPAINSGLRAAHRCWGVAILIGLGDFNKTLGAKTLDLLKGKTWKGSVFGGMTGDDIPKLVDMYLEGKLMVDEFVTNTVPLEKINEAYELMNKPSKL
ncbi:alcohol dehydrogenase class-3-like [Centruroides sculpturatus]|uniref:alcohol dehydrogenase class-3-like n=1 Tax=Centruroides sculpturatus TaxID=218467 RepID=UPI000C6E36A1|nr:alcohol dehydrogenase class-3-like [Centruroides sculpturatus]